MHRRFPPAVTGAKTSASTTGTRTVRVTKTVRLPGNAGPSDMALSGDSELWITEEPLGVVARVSAAGAAEFPIRACVDGRRRSWGTWRPGTPTGRSGSLLNQVDGTHWGPRQRFVHHATPEPAAVVSSVNSQAGTRWTVSRTPPMRMSTAARGGLGSASSARRDALLMLLSVL
jgi:hypothetical protein